MIYKYQNALFIDYFDFGSVYCWPCCIQNCEPALYTPMGSPSPGGDVLWASFIHHHVLFYSDVFVFSFFMLFKIWYWSSTEGSMIPACSWSFVLFLTRAMLKESILVCMYVFLLFFLVNLFQDWFWGFQRVCGFMACVQNGWETEWNLFLAQI